MMRQIKKQYALNIFLILISCLFWSSNTHAKISHLDLKGIHELIKPEFQAQVSPIFGYTLIGTQTLQNRRLYGNYGPRNDEHYCFKGTNIGDDPEDGLIVKNDCPQDYTSEWIQRLFPSQGGTHLEINPLDESDPIARLTSEVIGKVLGRVARVTDDQWSKSADMDCLQKDLKNMMFTELLTEQFKKSYDQMKKNTQKALVDAQLKKSKLKPRLGRNESDPEFIKALESKDRTIQRLQDELAENEIDNILRTYPTLNSFSDECHRIANVLVLALQESRFEAHRYPRYLPEHVLMAFFLKKANYKSDFISIFNEMREVLTEKGIQVLVDGSQQQNDFLNPDTNYKSADYKPGELESKLQEIAEWFVQNPEDLVFSRMESYFSRPFAPILHYSSSTKNQSGQKYSDCGETSLRNFFNIVTYNQKDRIYHIEYLEKNGLSIDEKLKQFYVNHSNAADEITQQHYDDWSEVVSNRQGITYRRPIKRINGPPLVPPGNRYELDAGLDNMLNIINQLLFSKDPESSPLAQAKFRSDKLDTLCKLLSRDVLSVRLVNIY